MGAKNPVNNRDTRTISKTCEECQRDFQTIQALKAHTLAKHPEKSKQSNSNQAESNDEKAAVVPPTSRLSQRLQKKKTVEPETVFVDIHSSASNSKKTVFECPVCSKVFQVYFSAFRHIENRHSADDDGNPIPLDTLDLKPIRKDMCTVCSKLFDGEYHSCEEISAVGNGGYCCLGCGKKFMSVSAFDNHVPGTHSDKVDSMFFENSADFQMWKNNMESQVRVKYLSLSNTSNRQYYQCNYVSPKNSAFVTHLCPSVLIVKEFPKGIQVHYYKAHHDHSCNYKLAKQFEKYILNTESVFKDNNILFASLTKKQENDLYKKLKLLLNKIISGSAKINVTYLKKLYNMALDMESFLQSYDEEHEDTDASINMEPYLSSLNMTVKKGTASDNNNDVNDSIKDEVDETDNEIVTTNKSMSDDQITKALEAPRASARLKRKSESSTPVSKKQKVESDKKTSETVKKAKETDKKPIESDKKASEFVKKVKETDKKPIESDKKASETVKKAKETDKKPGESDKKASNTLKKAKEIDKKPVETLIKASETDKKATETKTGLKENNSMTKDSKFISPRVAKSPSINQSPSFNDTYKKFIDSTLKKDSSSNKKSHNKKEIVKTKIGQFIPSPKKATQIKVESENVDKNVPVKKKKEPVKSSRSTSIANLNIKNLKYEVVEQENDCNILVLKI